jgi:hypothetical protein
VIRPASSAVTMAWWALAIMLRARSSLARNERSRLRTAVTSQLTPTSRIGAPSAPRTTVAWARTCRTSPSGRTILNSVS